MPKGKKSCNLIGREEGEEKKRFGRVLIFYLMGKLHTHMYKHMCIHVPIQTHTQAQ